MDDKPLYENSKFLNRIFTPLSFKRGKLRRYAIEQVRVWSWVVFWQLKKTYSQGDCSNRAIKPIHRLIDFQWTQICRQPVVRRAVSIKPPESAYLFDGNFMRSTSCMPVPFLERRLHPLRGSSSSAGLCRYRSHLFNRSVKRFQVEPGSPSNDIELEAEIHTEILGYALADGLSWAGQLLLVEKQHIVSLIDSARAVNCRRSEDSAHCFIGQ